MRGRVWPLTSARVPQYLLMIEPKCCREGSSWSLAALFRFYHRTKFGHIFWNDRNLEIWGSSFFLRIMSIHSSTLFHNKRVFRVLPPVFSLVVIQMHYSSGSATAEGPARHIPEFSYSLISDSLVSFQILSKPKTPSNLSTFEYGAQLASPRTNVCVRTIGHGRCACRGPTLTRSPSFGVWWTAAGRMTIQTGSIFGHFHCFTVCVLQNKLIFGIVRFHQNGFVFSHNTFYFENDAVFSFILFIPVANILPARILITEFAPIKILF